MGTAARSEEVRPRLTTQGCQSRTPRSRFVLQEINARFWKKVKRIPSVTAWTGGLPDVQYFLKPARSMPRRASWLFMNVFQTKPVRTFSAMSRVIPVSIPITSVSYHALMGLKAFTKPYLVQAEG